MLQSRNERDSSEILRRIRSGYQPDAVVRYMRTVATSDIPPRISDPSRLAVEVFLINLAHSTGSLQDILKLATLALDPYSNFRLPDSQAFSALRNRIVQLPYVESLLQRQDRLDNGPVRLLQNGFVSSPHTNALSDISTPTLPLASDTAHHDGSDQPPHWVPASPWTSLTNDDEAVSHLVSVFFTWHNPTWRFVEQDLFLQGKPFEVNAFKIPF